MHKYSNILSGLKGIFQYCDQQKYQKEPQYSFNICITNLTKLLYQYILSQSEKLKGSELKLPNIQGGSSKAYVDQQINDVKTIIQKKILGLNIYENKIQKINDDIRRQFDRKAAQLTVVTKQFQKTLESKMNKIEMYLHQTLYEYDKKIQGNLTKQDNTLTKSVDDKLKTMENNFTDDMQKLYKKITQLENKNINEYSPQKRQYDRSNQGEYQMNSSGVKLNVKRVGQSGVLNRLGTAERRNQSQILNKDYLNNYRQDQLRRNMVSQPKKIPGMKGLNSHIGSLRNNLEIKQPVRKQVQARDWAYENWGLQKYTFDRNFISAKQPSFIFGKKQIKNSYSFSVQMLEKSFATGLGIADQRYRKFGSIQQIKPKFIFFADGDYWEFQKKKKYASGFKQSQVVTVSVNALFNLIQWKVGGQIRHQIRSDLISQQKNWVPFIFLGATGATVGISEQ